MANKPTYKELEQRVLELEKTETERKQVEEPEERLKTLSEASFEAIFLSGKGICLDQNQTAKRMFGYTRAEAIGRHGTEWIVPKDHEQVKNNMASGVNIRLVFNFLKNSSGHKAKILLQVEACQLLIKNHCHYTPMKSPIKSLIFP